MADRPAPPEVAGTAGTDRAALAAHWTREAGFVQRVVRRAYRLVDFDPALEEADVAQEAFLAFHDLYQAWRPADDPPFGAYLNRRLAYTLRDRLRRLADPLARARPATAPPPPPANDDDDPPGDPEPVAEGPEPSLIACQTFEWLLAPLSPLDRRVMRLRYLEGLSVGAIALYLALPHHAVRSRLRRAMAGVQWRLRVGEPGTGFG